MSTSRPPAIVYGVYDPATLGVMRNLREHGARVIAISPRKDSLGFHSRYANEHRLCPDAGKQPGELIDYLLREMPRGVLIPGFDTYSLLISKQQETLREQGFTTLFTHEADVTDLVEKDRLGETAADDPDLPVPGTHVVTEETIEALTEEMSLPWVLKVIRTKDTRVVRRPSDLRPGYRSLVERLDRRGIQGYRIAAQQWIPGNRIYHIGMLLDAHGKLRGGMVARRRRHGLRPDGSERHATRLEWIEEPELLERAHRFAARRRIRGLVEMECKLDEAGGVYRLFDVNPRIWGWIEYTVGAGFDYPVGYYETALGREWSQPRREPLRPHYIVVFAPRPAQSDLLATFRQWRYERIPMGRILGDYRRMLGVRDQLVVGYGDRHDLMPRLVMIWQALMTPLRRLLRRRAAPR